MASGTLGSGEQALVLGGGGVTGVAWELGVIAGLYEQGLDLRNADLIVGTSAGSVVGAQIAGGTAIEQLYGAQLVPPTQTAERAVDFDPAQMEAAFARLMSGGNMDPLRLRAAIGGYALSAVTIPEAERKDIIAARLPIAEWPAGRLVIVAVDTQSGQERFFDRDSGVPLVDAVAASCAVPGVWPPVTIKGRRYMDGGVRSVNNADLASGFARVLIFSPAGMADWGPLGSLRAEVSGLESGGSTVRVVAPDEASVEAIGPNVLDPARRAGSVRAGREQGKALAEELRLFWHGG